MNKKYDLIECEALKLVKIGKELCLIDTGSPFSFFSLGKITIDGITFKNEFFEEILKQRLMELNEYNKESFKAKITGIIGNDIILNLGITINKKEGYVIFNSNILDNGLNLDFIVKEIEKQKYIVFKELKLKGVTSEGMHSFVLDTGALVSTFRWNLCCHAQYAYRASYYYPALGAMMTSDFMFFNLEGNNKIDIIASKNINNIIDEQFDFIGVDGELCFHDVSYDVLSINPRSNKIYWK